MAYSDADSVKLRWRLDERALAFDATTLKAAAPHRSYRVERDAGSGFTLLADVTLGAQAEYAEYVDTAVSTSSSYTYRVSTLYDDEACPYSNGIEAVHTGSHDPCRTLGPMGRRRLEALIEVNLKEIGKRGGG